MALKKVFEKELEKEMKWVGVAIIVFVLFVIFLLSFAILVVANAILADENQAQPIPEPVKPIEPMREDFDRWWQKERKEEQNYKEAMEEYKKQLADYIKKTEEQKQTVDNLQMKNLQDMEAFRTESEKVNQNLNGI